MSEKKSASATARKPRADAARNRILLVETAKAAFADTGPDVSLDEIARRAGVGIGTLYRHFPARAALLEAVYRHEVEQLAAAGTRLLATQPPVAALRGWMRLFIDYIATKKIIAPALSAIAGGSSDLFAASGEQIIAAMTGLVARAVAQGEIRSDIDPMDLLYALAGFTNAGGANWETSAYRLIDVLIEGLKARAGE